MIMNRLSRMSRMLKRLGMVAVVLGMVGFTSDAQAVPSFARSENMACTGCHTAWPALNAFGRRYKDLGYMVMKGQPAEHADVSKTLSLPTQLPLSLLINARPFDKKRNKSPKIRALHEVELMGAGNFAKWGSFFVELEAEDEKDGFNVFVPIGVGAIHVNEYLNVVAGLSGPFFYDPYNNLNGRRFTRQKTRLFSEGGNTGASVGGRLQNVAVYGRAGKVLYGVGLGADVGDDFEGAGPDNWSARLAVDVLKKELSIGGFVYDGSEDFATGPGVTTALDFTRAGVDVQGQIGPFNYQGAYMWSEDEKIGGPGIIKEQNNLVLAELFYTFSSEKLQDMKIPIRQIVPFLRYEYFERNDGNEKHGDLILNLQAYLAENVRVSFEYAEAIDGGTGRRFTGFVVFGL